MSLRKNGLLSICASIFDLQNVIELDGQRLRNQNIYEKLLYFRYIKTNQ
jgi:hypothetical protein